MPAAYQALLALEAMRLPAVPSSSEPRTPDPAMSLDPSEPLVSVQPDRRLIVRPLLAERGYPGSGSTLYLRREAAARLKTAAASLPDDFSLVLVDAWRSDVAQMALHARMARESPEGGAFPVFDPFDEQAGVVPPHRTGGAVDVGLLGHGGLPWPMDPVGNDGKPVPTPTTAALEGLLGAARPALLGRRLLYYVMTRAGFTNFELEWWHYDFGNDAWCRRTASSLPAWGPTAP